MFTEKRVPIIDRSVVEEGDFITFCEVNKEYTSEDGDYQWVAGKQVNGIVSSVSETAIRIVNSEEDNIGLYLDCLFNSPTFDVDEEVRGYKILGIMKNAISKEDK